MYVTKPYDRLHAQEYAEAFALNRNVLFTDFTGFGGDCTNFVSQCLFAGCCEMNYTPTFGWYYISETERAPAWSGVAYLYNFLTQNTAEGPFGHEVRPAEVEIGDIVQLGGRNGVYYHTLIVTGFSRNSFLVSAHSDDALNRPLSTYSYQRIRYIHIDGVRFDMPSTDACFDGMMRESSLGGDDGDSMQPPKEEPSLMEERAEMEQMQQMQEMLETEQMQQRPQMQPDFFGMQLEPEMGVGEGLETDGIL